MNENDILDIEQLFPNGDELPATSENLTENGTPIEEGVEGAGDPETEQSDVEGLQSSETYVNVVDLPEYSMENPLPVVLVEEEPMEEELEVYALNGRYYGTISDTYLDFFEGIVQKLKPSEHYVVWRSGQYAYNMAYGEDLWLSGQMFGGDCRSVSVYRNSSNVNTDWYVEYSDDILSLNASQLFVYSDLGEYPMLERGGTYGTDMALLFAICVATVSLLACRMLSFIRKRITRC